MKNNRTGFTLIELLVVMSILSLLVVALLPMLTQGQVEGNKTADAANLRWHFQAFTVYKLNNSGALPRGGGSQFILAPWVEGTIPHTLENIDRYFSPSIRGTDERWLELKEDIEIRDVWRRMDEITSEDTHYAGRAREFKRGMERAEQAWMANDNEGGNHYQDGTILVLMSGGAVRRLNKKHLMKHGYPEDGDDEDFIYEVGPESPHPLLRKLDK